MSRSSCTTFLAAVTGVVLALFLVAGHQTLDEGAMVASSSTSVENAFDDLAACGRCGDGVCVAFCGENASSCPADCSGDSSLELAACGRCGDGFCAPQCGENALSCPKDCAGDSSITDDSLLEAAACGRCGDGACVASCGENALTCPKDCSGSSS